MDQKQNPSPKRWLAWQLVWWVLIIGLFVWNVLLFWPRSQPSATISYTAFLDQVRSGNVTHVQIAGDQISGTLTHPITVTGTVVTVVPTAQFPQVQSQSTQYTSFSTTFPQAIGDPTLLPLLESKGIAVDVQPPPPSWLGALLDLGLPILLVVVFIIWMGRRMGNQSSGMFSFGQSKARQVAADRPTVTFKDVADASEAKEDLQQIVDFLRHPEKYHNIGARIPRGILLVGPPGTGKTLKARAVAGEAGVPFFYLSASEFVEMFVGVGASRVRDLFARAKTAAPAIVFIDELDAVGRRRGTGLGTTNDEREQTLDQLLAEMDGFDERQNVIIIAATNRPDVLDPALLRPGRFDRQITVELPDRAGREQVLRIHTRSLHLAPDVNLSVLARTTTGLSGADLANLCNEAALNAARRDHSAITRADFDAAWDKVILGGVRPLLLDDAARRVIAYHEAGHALVAWFTPEADVVRKITVIPHGRALGVTEQLPGDDRYNYSKTYLLARLDVMLGGRTAEEIALGDITTGAENDLVEATKLARRMVTRWGMGVLGLAAFQGDGEQPFLGYQLAQGHDYSEATAARVDQDVQRLLDERHSVVYHLLSEKREKLDSLVKALLRAETIEQEELARLLGPRPAALLLPPASIPALPPTG